MAKSLIRPLNFLNFSPFSQRNAFQHLFFKTHSSFHNDINQISKRSFAVSKVFDRTKEHVNVGTIGHVDHGKTTLSAAITKVLSELKDGSNAEFVPYEQIDFTKEEKSRGITINATTIEYESPKRHYSHTDCPGHRDYIKNMISGASQLETAILVVAAGDGVSLQTREHMLLAKQIGIPNLVVYINKCDEESDKELLDLVEMEIKDLIAQHGFDVNKVPFIRGSGLCALQGIKDEIGKNSIVALINALDKAPLPPRNDTEPFMMPIETVYTVSGIGTVVAGRVDRGKIKVNDPVEIVGLQTTSLKSTISGVEMFHKQVKEGQSGDNLGLGLRGISRDSVRRGQVVVFPGSAQVKSQFKAQCYFLTQSEGGRGKPVKAGFKPQFFLKTANVTGEIMPFTDREVITPGDNAEITVNLTQPYVLRDKMRFAIRESGTTVAVGVVTEVIA